MNPDREGIHVDGMSTLKHVAIGLRHWASAPRIAYHRPDWEFVAILSGRAASSGETNFAEPMCAPSLWVFAPGVVHGWSSDEGAGNLVAVFEYSVVSPILEEFVGEAGSHQVTLDSSSRVQVERFARELQVHVLNRSALTRIYATKVQADLSILLLRDRLELNGQAPCVRKRRLLVRRCPASSTQD